MNEKKLGYVLIVLGIVIMLFCAGSVYQVFTKQSQPVTLFQFPGISIDMSKLLASSLPQGLNTDLPEMKQEIFPAEMVNRPMNLIFHTIMMGFIASIGMKIAQIGTMLTRTITVDMKTNTKPQIDQH